MLFGLGITIRLRTVTKTMVKNVFSDSNENFVIELLDEFWSWEQFSAEKFGFKIPHPEWHF